MIVEVELVLGKACKARKVAKTDAFPTACKSAPSADDNPTNAYDYQGRLVDKDDGTDVEVYVYDGWTEHGSAEMVQARPAPEGLRQRVPSGQRRNNRIAKYVNGSLSSKNLWGLDLSGTMQGAGGVGGLLKEGNLYATYDANGNIVQKLNSSGAASMAVEYDPFGNVISGILVGEYGFSTKPLVDGLDWYYYGYRYYDPVTGRWPSRDPIEERGGLNLYAMVENDPINRIDVFGLRTFINCTQAQENFINQLISSIVSSLSSQKSFLDGLQPFDIRQNYLSWSSDLGPETRNEIFSGMVDYITAGSRSIERTIIKINRGDVSIDCCGDNQSVGNSNALGAYQSGNITLFSPEFWQENDLLKSNVLAHEFGHAVFGPNHITNITGVTYKPPRNLARLTRNADFVGDVVELGVNHLLDSLSFQFRIRYQTSGPNGPTPPTPPKPPVEPPCTNLSCGI